jgi:hypothetical protein
LRLGEPRARHLSVVPSAPLSGVTHPHRDPSQRDPSENPTRAELAALNRALALAARRARGVYDEREPWRRRVRAAPTALLELFDEQPQIARLCVIPPAAIGPEALARREEIIAALAHVIDEGRDSTRRQQPPPLTARGVVAGTIGAIRARLQQPDAEPLIELLNPLMSFIVLPYLGAGAARRELSAGALEPR